MTHTFRTFQIIPAFTGYGADNLILCLHKLFLQQGVRSNIISLTRGIPAGIPFVDSLDLENPYHPKAFLKLSIKLKEIVKQDQTEPFLLHAHLTPCQFYVPIAARIARLRMPLLTTEHNTNNRRRTMAFGKLFDRKLYNPYRHIICISEGVKTSMTNWLPKINNRLITIPNGVNTDEFNTLLQPVQNSECPIIISVGRIHKQKNYQTAIKACALLKDLNFEYHILGDGVEKPVLRKLIEEQGLVGKVKLLGFQSNVVEYLSRSNVFFMPSYWEGFGLAVVEAMACGLPVVVSDVPGVREIIGQNQKSGFLIDPHDPVSISEKLRYLICSPKLRTEMGFYNRLHAELYSIKNTAEGYLNLYQKVLLNNDF
ncbi:glycosyltransferase [Candidatus Latescibacterota bacterium]